MTCLQKTVKFSLFITNFIVFVLSLVVFGLGIWVLVDAPSFLDLFDQAQTILADNNIGDGSLSVPIYTTAAYLLVAVAAIVAIVAFFGCCGAWKESKCMLATYFTIVLALLIAFIVGAVLGYTGDFESEIKSPLEKALANYKDNPSSDNAAEMAYKDAWNQAQKDFLCCGVNNVTDWNIVSDFPDGFNKPEGCCAFYRNGNALNDDQIKECRKSVESAASETYHFEGCWTLFLNDIESNTDIVVGVAIGVVVVLFLNALFAFSLCAMVE